MIDFIGRYFKRGRKMKNLLDKLKKSPKLLLTTVAIVATIVGFIGGISFEQISRTAIHSHHQSFLEPSPFGTSNKMRRESILSEQSSPDSASSDEVNRLKEKNKKIKSSIKNGSNTVNQ